MNIQKRLRNMVDDSTTASMLVKVSTLREAADEIDRLTAERNAAQVCGCGQRIAERTRTVKGKGFGAANACPRCRISLDACGCGHGSKAKEGEGHV